MGYLLSLVSREETFSNVHEVNNYVKSYEITPSTEDPKEYPVTNLHPDLLLYYSCHSITKYGIRPETSTNEKRLLFLTKL